LTVWDTAGGSKYRSYRMNVADRKIAQWDLGVSMEKYHEEVKKEYEKIQQSNESIGIDNDLLEVAFKRAEENIKKKEWIYFRYPIN